MFEKSVYLVFGAGFFTATCCLLAIWLIVGWPAAKSPLLAKRYLSAGALGAAGVAVLVFTFASAVSREDVRAEIFGKVSRFEPNLSASQVRPSPLDPSLTEIYHDGKMRYVLGTDYLVKGQVFNIESGRNYTQERLAAYKTLEDTAIERPPGHETASEPKQVSRKPADHVATKPGKEAAAEEGVAQSERPGAVKKGKSTEQMLAVIANSQIPDAMTVVYPAKGKMTHQITVFSDVTCPHCKRMHKDTQRLQEEGIKVRYALFPRRGPDSPESEVMGKILCAPTMAERRNLLERAFDGDALGSELGCGNNYVDSIRTMAVSRGAGLSVELTPTIFADNGVRLNGYPDVKTLVEYLDKGA